MQLGMTHRILAAFAFLVGATPAFAAPRTTAVQRQAVAYARQHNTTPVARRLLSRVRSRPVLKVRSPEALRSYAAAMVNSVEIIYRPAPSEPGHIHVRAGDKIFDLGNVRFARAGHFITGGSMLTREDAYGFVLPATPVQIQRLQEIYAEKVGRVTSGALPFDEYGRRPGESCETFVTNSLREVCPEFGLDAKYRFGTMGAHGLAKWCLTESAHLQAVTIYSPSHRDPAADEGFTFRKVEGGR